MYQAICFRDYSGYGILVEVDTDDKEVSYYCRDYNYTPYNYWVYLYTLGEKEDYEVFNQFINDRLINVSIKKMLHSAVKYFVEEIETEDYAN